MEPVSTTADATRRESNVEIQNNIDGLSLTMLTHVSNLDLDLNDLFYVNLMLPQGGY